jgi:zinc D-Ala-D-Ala dipeptidase
VEGARYDARVVEQSAVNEVRVEDIARHPGFRRLASLRGVAHDLRYAGSNNFAGRVLYEPGIDCGWLREEAAAGLEAAADWLRAHRPGHTLIVLDALRPQRVQAAIWADVVGTPMQPYFAEPTRGSIHSFGMAVDVTLLAPDGHEVDMGSGFDQMDEASHPEHHARLLAGGRLTAAHIAERTWLREAMAQGGFAGIPTEWWHFDHGQRDHVRRAFPRVV